MNKSIWHTPSEQPDPFKSWNILVVYEANDRKEMMYSTQFLYATDGMYVNRWCYLDDLLALETELDRTKKQLEIAVDALKLSRDIAIVTSVARGLEPKEDEINIATTKALDQIKALEQKDVK